MGEETAVPPAALRTRWEPVPAYLNAASLGLPTTLTVDAMRSALDDWQAGRATAAGYDRYVEASRTAFTRIAGTSPGRVAIGSQVSALVGLVAGALTVCDVTQAARRFDVSPAWLCWAGAVPALETFAQADLDQIRAHDVRLADAVLAGLDLEPAGSAIVSLADPDGTLLRRCADAGLSVSARAGRVRMAFHVWNDEDDVHRVLDVARGSAAGRRPG